MLIPLIPSLLVSRSLASLLETILEATSHRLQVLHTTRSLTTTTRTLQSPIVYTLIHFIFNTYNVSSWHQDIHKNHNDPSGYGTHDDCIFCKSCESLCASYRKRKYPSSTSLLLYYSTNTHYSLFNHFKSFISFNRIKEHTILYFGIQQ